MPQTMPLARKLGRSSLIVSALGLGGWAIGGPFLFQGRPDGWGDVDDEESVRAIRRAIDLGVTLFDTADVYGIGRSEEVIGRAIAGRRDSVVIATKFGWTYDREKRAIIDSDVSPGYIAKACEASLRRLGTDTIDLYQLHVGTLSPGEAAAVGDALEELAHAGKIRAFGWSTDDPAMISSFLHYPHFAAVQSNLNVFDDAPEMIALCEQEGLADLNRSPLAMGLLSGKFRVDSQLSPDDVRGAGHSWVAYFRDGKPLPELLDKLAAVREILTSKGRTPAQGALAWILGRSDVTIPIPGFKTVRQAEENARAMEFGPLTPAQMNEIATILAKTD